MPWLAVSLVGAVFSMLLKCLRWPIAQASILGCPWAGGCCGRVACCGSAGAALPRWACWAWAATAASEYLALQTSTPVNVTLIASSMPVWMLAVGALRDGERASRKQLLGAAFSLAGVALVLSGEVVYADEARLVPVDLFDAAGRHAVGLLFADRPRAAERRLRAALAVVGVPDGAGGVRGHVLGLLAAGGEWALRPHAHRVERLGGWRCCSFVAIGPSLIAYRCWGLGVATVGPAVASFFNNLTPLFAALLSAAVLGEAPRWYHALAFVLIAAGIVVSSRR